MSIAAFAQLGRIWREAQFAEAQAIADPDILSDVLDLLEEEIGKLDRLSEVTLNPDTDTFKGRAQQRISIGRSQIYEFELSPETINYRMVNADEAAEFADTDEGWLEIAEFAAAKKGKGSRSGMKLNCKPGNVQCGGKCQSGNKRCRIDPSVGQKAAIQSIAAKAKSGGTSKQLPSPDAFANAQLQKFRVASGHGDEGLIFSTEVDGQRYFVKRSNRNESAADLASYEIAKTLGYDNYTVPIQSVRIGGKQYLAQPFLERSELDTIGNPRSLKAISENDALRATTFDYLIGNVDRHAGNVGLSDGKPLLFDHDYAFHEVTFRGSGTPPDRLDVAVNAIVRDRLGYDPEKPDSRQSQRVRSLELPAEDVRRILDSRSELMAIARTQRLNSDGLKSRIDRLEQVYRANGRVTLGDLIHQPPAQEKETTLDDFLSGFTPDQLAAIRANIQRQ